MKKIKKVISLFSGAGGMDLGFIKARFQICLANDFDENAVKTYQTNIGNHILHKDIRELFISDAETNRYNNIDVVIGGPPCQGFSMAGNIGRTFKEDWRNYLYKEFVRVVDKLNPKFFVMENVARLFNHNSGRTKDEIVTDFNEIGYDVEVKVLNSADFGTPQIRTRVFFIGKRKSINSNINFPEPYLKKEKYKTIKSAINHFPKLISEEISLEYLNHESMNHTTQMLEKMSFVKDGCGRECIPETY